MQSHFVPTSAFSPPIFLLLHLAKRDINPHSSQSCLSWLAWFLGESALLPTFIALPRP